jgi:hypothetical protein
LVPSLLNPIVNYSSYPKSLARGRHHIQLGLHIFKKISIIDKAIQAMIIPCKSRNLLRRLISYIIIRPDSYDKGVGCVLYQNDPTTNRPSYILFLSHVFSAVAQRWPIEAYGDYWSVCEKLDHLRSAHVFIRTSICFKLSSLKCDRCRELSAYGISFVHIPDT